MEYAKFLAMLYSVGGLTQQRCFRRVVLLVNIALVSYGLHRAERPRCVFEYCPLLDLFFLEPTLCTLGNCCGEVCLVTVHFLFHTHYCLYWWLKSVLKVTNDSFFASYGWWELKFRYCPLKVDFQYTDDLNPCSVWVIHIYQPLCSGRIWHKVNF